MLSTQDVITQTSKHNNSADSHIDKNNEGAGASNEEPDVTVRKYGEVFLSTLSSVAALVEYPKGKICGWNCCDCFLIVMFTLQTW